MQTAPSDHRNRPAVPTGSPRVLILSASTGNGHMSAMAALEHELKQRGVECLAVDTLDHTGKAFKAWYGGGYERCVRTKPEAWGHLYKISDSPRLAFHFQGLLDMTFVSRTRRLLNRFRPTVVVCTHSLPQPFLAHERKRLGYKMSIVVTDLYPHLMWLRGEPDQFLLPSAWTQRVLEERKPSFKGRSVVTGIPVHAAFAEEISTQEARTRLGLDPNKPTVLITVGGIGAGPVLEVCQRLSKLPYPAQVIVVAGRNKALYQQLSSQEAALNDGSAARFQIFGSVPLEKMAAFMKASDFLVGKSGGLTTSEALACGCGFLVYEPMLIPGQEFDNARFLAESGSGALLHNLDELDGRIRDLLSSPAALEQMRASARENGRPRSTPDAVDAILRL